MAVTATLKVQLTADTVVVAESDDPKLWHNVFSAIHSGSSDIKTESETSGPSDRRLSEEVEKTKKQQDLGAVGKFAQELGIAAEDVVGACAPDPEAPFIRLDQRYWEALRNNTGSRGRASISPTALAATLLCLWFKHAELGNPTVSQCQDVLKTINLADKNTGRSFRNADWLQARNGTVVVNPARWSQAVRVAKAYCLRKSTKESE